MFAGLSTGALCVLLLCTAAAAPASAQPLPSAPPGPFVIDLRGTTLGMPQAFGFYPPLPTETLVPARGFGFDAGAHVYMGRLGPGRLGVGANVLRVRGTSGEAVAITAHTIAPQLSLNFGTSQGWSYLSGGVGVAWVRGRFREGIETAESSRASGAVAAINFGGGARWFFATNFALSVDLRLHRLAENPARVDFPGTLATILGSASVGISLK